MSELQLMMARRQFLKAVKGIPGHHVIAAMNIATPGIEWRHCSKTSMAEAYAQHLSGKRFSLSWQANDGMTNLDLDLLRRAALERKHGNREWHTYYRPRSQA